jgi:thymidylate synthase
MQATHEYHKLLQYILDNGKKKTDRTGTGTTSIFDYKIKFDMSQGFPLITTKRLHLRSIIHELLWFLKGSTNTKYLKENGVTIWDEWAKDGELGPIYGKQWVSWTKKKMYLSTDGSHEKIYDEADQTVVNQIACAIDALKNNPDSRRIMVSAWNVGEIDQMALPPCHWAFELYTEELTHNERCKLAGGTAEPKYEAIREMQSKTLDERNIPKRRLHLKWHQRSVDTFLGLPFNIASYALLLHMFAQQTNMVPGQLVGDLTNVHIYDNHMEYVKKQLDRPYYKYNAPTLSLNGHDTDGKEYFPKGIFHYEYDDFDIQNYECFPNWKNVPIAI